MNIKKLKNELFNVIKHYALEVGYDESDANDYVVVDINCNDNECHVQIRNDLFGYYDNPKLIEQLDNIIAKYDQDSYLEPYDDFVWDAFLQGNFIDNDEMLEDADPADADIQDAGRYAIVIPQFEKGYQVGEEQKIFNTIEEVKAFIEEYMDKGKIEDLVITKDGFTKLNPEDILDGKIEETVNDAGIAESIANKMFKKLLSVNISRIENINQFAEFYDKFKSLFAWSQKIYERYKDKFKSNDIQYFNRIKNLYNEFTLINNRIKGETNKEGKTVYGNKETVIQDINKVIDEYNQIRQDIFATSKLTTYKQEEKMKAKNQLQEESKKKEEVPKKKEDEPKKEEVDAEGEFKVLVIKETNNGKQDKIAKDFTKYSEVEDFVKTYKLNEYSSKHYSIVAILGKNSGAEKALLLKKFTKKSADKNGNGKWDVSIKENNLKELKAQGTEIIKKEETVEQAATEEGSDKPKKDSMENTIDWKNEIKYSDKEFQNGKLYFILNDYPIDVVLDVDSLNVTLTYGDPTSVPYGNQMVEYDDGFEVEYDDIDESDIEIESNEAEYQTLEITRDLIKAVENSFEDWLYNHLDEFGNDYDEY